MLVITRVGTPSTTIEIAGPNEDLSPRFRGDALPSETIENAQT
jgi:hypothetical protein